MLNFNVYSELGMDFILNFVCMFSQKRVSKNKYYRLVYPIFFFKKNFKKEQHQDGFTRLPLALLATLQLNPYLGFFLLSRPREFSAALLAVLSLLGNFATEENDDGCSYFRGRSRTLRRPVYGGDVMGGRRRRGNLIQLLSSFC